MWNPFRKSDKEPVPPSEGGVVIEAVPMEADFGPRRPTSKEEQDLRKRQREAYDTIADLTLQLKGINRRLEEIEG